MKTIFPFLSVLRKWYVINQRSLPFRGTKDPYKIWVSEILLQQTQMSRGVEFYKRFVRRFKNIQSLANVSWEEFLPYFEGLGYYNRGRNMLKAAQVITKKYEGIFPRDYAELVRIPGIGPYTANAVLSFSFDEPVIPLDTNVKRLLGRVFSGVSKLDERTKEGAKVLATVTKAYKTSYSSGEMNQAMMDFCSAVCFQTKPDCLHCVFRKQCLYFQKENPHLVRRGQVKRLKWKRKYVMAEIYEGKKLLKHKGKLLGGYLEKGDERGFLKQLAKEKMGLTISIRPAYKMWVEKDVKYSVHRCYVLVKS